MEYVVIETGIYPWNILVSISRPKSFCWNASEISYLRPFRRNYWADENILRFLKQQLSNQQLLFVAYEKLVKLSSSHVFQYLSWVEQWACKHLHIAKSFKYLIPDLIRDLNEIIVELNQLALKMHFNRALILHLFYYRPFPRCANFRFWAETFGRKILIFAWNI